MEYSKEILSGTEYSALTIPEYLDRLSSRDPVPGGGGTSALIGAIGTALGCMVGSLTVGKKKYAAVEADIQKCMEESLALQKNLSHLIDRDAEVFEPLSKAYGLPKDTPEEAAHKDEVMAKCLAEAASVPLEILDDCAKAIALIEEFAAKGSALAISDAGCAAVLIRSAAQGAALNVFINTKYMKDREEAERLNAHVSEVLTDVSSRADAVYENIKKRLGG